MHVFEPEPILRPHVPTRIALGCCPIKIPTDGLALFVQYGQYRVRDAQGHVRDVIEAISEWGCSQLVVLRKRPCEDIKAYCPLVGDNEIGNACTGVVNC